MDINFFLKIFGSSIFLKMVVLSYKMIAVK
jgi:hypothetical protein